jgi:alpha-L-rhamnosidase
MVAKIARREFTMASGLTAGVAALATNRLYARSVRVRVVDLKVDYLNTPLGLENLRPQLSWRLESSERNVRQSAYRILVASSEEALKEGRGDLWGSGKIESRKSFGIPYQGRALTSRQRCWWAVQIWDERDVASVPSAPSWWEMGLLGPREWIAQWLAAEDAVARADREAGLHWIWGEPTREKSTRRFRFEFQLPGASQAGELYAVTNDWSWWTQITRIWIDGEVLSGTGIWSFDWSTIAPTAAPDSLSNWLALRPLSAGEHLIAVEVNTATLPTNVTVVHGLAFLARFQLETGEMLRIGSSTHGKTSLAEDEDWFRPRYSDWAWETTRPAPIESYQPWPAQPAMHLRREFSIEKPVAKARLYATALGAYEGRLNGRRIGDALLTPEVSRFDKRVLYRVYDVTQMLRPGVNVLGFTVGDGWYASFDGRFAWGLPPRRMLAQLELYLADGFRQIVATGPGWRAAQSAIRVSEIRFGEVYDARLEQPGWDTAQFDDSRWQDAAVSDSAPGRLVAQMCPPIRVTQRLSVRAISQPNPGIFVFDFGQNFGGWCRLKVQGARGTRVELKFAELLAPSGEVLQVYTSIGEPKRDVFILKGDAAGETFEPHFTYRGFRYVQVSGLPVEPTVQSLEGVVVHSDLGFTGRLRVGAPLVDQLWRNTLWSQRSNFVGIPTDCPSREQRGWMGDAGIFWDAAAFNMDVYAFTSRQMDNVADGQAENGAFPMVAPVPRSNDAIYLDDGSPPGWGDAGVILPWIAWRRYGDLAIVEKNWDAMNRYLQFILDHNPDYVWRNKRGRDYGDFLALAQIKLPSTLPTTPKDLIGTAYWAHSAVLLTQMTEAIGRTDDANRLQAISDRVRRAFNEAFVKSDGTVGEGSQTGYILALQFGLLPEKTKRAAAAQLATDIRGRGVSLTTGILGTQFVLDVLADAGFADLTYDLLLRTEFPSWGHMIRRGATTIWESWSGELQDGDKIIQMSRNHYQLGSVCGFLFRRMAGIDAATPGFETIRIRPVLDARVKYGGADYDSVMGRVSTDWTQASDSRFTLDVIIPANATAYIHLPASRDSRIEEGRREIADRNDMRIVNRLDREAVVELGSGTYRFEVSRDPIS